MCIGNGPGVCDSTAPDMGDAFQVLGTTPGVCGALILVCGAVL